MRHGIHRDSFQLESERHSEWEDPLVPLFSENVQNFQGKSRIIGVWISTKPGSPEALVGLQGNSKLVGSLLSTSWQLPVLLTGPTQLRFMFPYGLARVPPLNRPSFHS